MTAYFRVAGGATVVVCYSTVLVQPALRAVKGSTPYLQFPVDSPQPCERWGDFIPLRVKHYAIFALQPSLTLRLILRLDLNQYKTD